MKKILISSVYCKSNYNWSKLQKYFIIKNTKDFHLTVFLNREKKENIESGFEIIGNREDIPPKDFIECSIEHSKSLSSIFEYFRNEYDNYENFLILDSDCFPIQKNWLDILLLQMKNKNKKCAAIMRVENLSIFPHPCAMLITKEALFDKWLSFDVGLTKNFLGESIVDVCCQMPVNNFFPMLRTNVWNPHPLFYGIYNDLFYHHGCGSRTIHYRSDWYYKSTIKNDNLWNAFFKSPEKFIFKLKQGQIITM